MNGYVGNGRHGNEFPEDWVIMRIAITVIIALLLGIGTGIGTAKLRLQSSAWDGDPAARGGLRHGGGPEGSEGGKARFSELEFDFGAMDISAEGSHDFIITNVGEGPLQVEAGETSCGCTLSEIERTELAPGESTEVTVTWRADGKVGPYRHTATVHTSDPEQSRVTLTVSGRITQVVRVVPQELAFGQLAMGEPADGEVELFCHLDEPLEVVDWEFSEPEEAQFFEVTVGPLPEEAIESEPDAKSGVGVRVALKPGLPQGAFRQTIRLRTNLDEVPEVAVPVRGNLTGDISIVAIGSGWEADHNMLTLGTVQAASGVRRQFLLVVRGPHRSTAVFEPVRVFPDWLEVEVGKTSEIGGGTVTQTPLWIAIPEDAPPAVHLGSEQGEMGEVRLKTNHPKTPELRIRLRFAVEGQ